MNLPNDRGGEGFLTHTAEAELRAEVKELWEMHERDLIQVSEAHEARRKAEAERDEWRRISAEQQADYGQLQADAERLGEALRGVLTGRVILDATEEGTPILLDLSTDPATPIRF